MGFREQSLADRLSRIEYTTSTALPLVNVYTRKAIRELLKNTGFTVDDIWVRKLVREDLPGNFFSWFYKMIPQLLLDRIGRMFGWYIIAKATKV